MTAQSYVDAWNYAAYGPNAYILNFLFDKIEGYDALNPSTGTPKTKELSGLKVVSDTEFTVKLTDPFSQFEYTLGFDAFDPLPKAFFQDPKGFDEQPIGDGPYMMDGKWQHDQAVNLQRYPDYAGTPGFADKITLAIYQGDAAWLDFQAGNLDVTNVGSDHLNEARKSYSDTLSEEPGASLLYLNLPLYDPQYQNPEVRQALSLALDRQAVMNAILVAETPATDFMPPSVTGYREGVCQYCQYNVDLAKQKLADAGGFNGTLTLNFYADDTTLEQAMEAVATQWKDNLGIDVKLNAIPQNTYFSGSSPIYQKKMTGPWWDGWTEDYPSIQDFLEPIYGANGGYNTSGYLNKQFDATLNQGNQQGLEEAIPTYQQADDIDPERHARDPVGLHRLQHRALRKCDERGEGARPGRTRPCEGAGRGRVWGERQRKLDGGDRVQAVPDPAPAPRGAGIAGHDLHRLRAGVPHAGRPGRPAGGEQAARTEHVQRDKGAVPPGSALRGAVPVLPRRADPR